MIEVRFSPGTVVLVLDKKLQVDLSPFNARELGELLYRRGCEADVEFRDGDVRGLQLPGGSEDPK